MASLQCPITAPHAPSELALSSVLLVGIVLSYVPQQLTIWLGKSSEGLSPWFLLLGSIATISTVANVLLLQWHVIGCCAVWSPLGCFENALGVLQLTSQALMFLAIGLLYLHYFPQHLKFASAPVEQVEQVDQAEDERAPLLSPPDSVSTTVTARLWIVSRRIAIAVLVYLLATISIVALALALTPKPHPPAPATPGDHDNPIFAAPAPHLVALAGLYGGIATLMSCLQFLPQIVHTYDAKDPGALSIGTMLMQTPGTLLLIYSLSLRPGTNVSTYLSYCVSATCQGTLLVLSLVYLHRKRRQARSLDHHPAATHTQEFRYGDGLVVTDESTAPGQADDVASPLFATLRSSPQLAAASTGVPAPASANAIDDDESLVEDPPAIHLTAAHLLPTAPPTITSSSTAAAPGHVASSLLLHPSSSSASSLHAHVLHPSPPHSPLGSMVAVKSLRFAPGASGSVAAAGGTLDSRSIDTLGSIVSSPSSHAAPVEEAPHQAERSGLEIDDTKAFASAIQSHCISALPTAHVQSPLAQPAPHVSTPRFEMDDSAALDAALTAALPPSDLDLDEPAATLSDVEPGLAQAIARTLPPSLDSLDLEHKEAKSASTRSLLNEPLGDTESVAPSVHAFESAEDGIKHQLDEKRVQVELDSEVARAVSPTAEGDADGNDDDMDPLSEMSVNAKVDPLLDMASAEASLVSVGTRTTGSSTTASSRQRSGAKRKGGGAGKKKKSGTRKAAKKW